MSHEVLQSWLQDGGREELGPLLAAFIPRQRWFGSKTRTVARVGVADWAWLESPDVPAALFLLEISYDKGSSERYSCPLAFLPAPLSRGDSIPEAAIAGQITISGHSRIVCDALAMDEICLRLVHMLAAEDALAARDGVVKGSRSSVFDDIVGPQIATLGVRRSTAEQSNTTIRFGDRLMLKLLRRLEPGTNPDLEVTRFLTERTDFRQAPLLAGALEYEQPGREPTTLALAQRFVPSAANGWEHMLDLLAGCLHSWKQGEGYREDSPEVARCVSLVALLGKRTAELHLALASDPSDERFRPEQLVGSDLEAVAQRMLHHLEACQESVRRKAGDLVPAVQPDAERFVRLQESLQERVVPPAVPEGLVKIRCHGDYHLGQVLATTADVVILDFEGEPTRPLAERRARHCALKDVAGMLRSFSYAAHAAWLAAGGDGGLRPAVEQWRLHVAREYEAAYERTASGAPFLPKTAEASQSLLDFFVLDKALYELHYELNNRPDWVAIPLHGILDLVN